ncbi:MAG: hypothetical protein PHX10_09180, partial [Gallionellaceae bacterium]|nr:hypothetical protein [Gallionellaceae bacterium]
MNSINRFNAHTSIILNQYSYTSIEKPGLSSKHVAGQVASNVPSPPAWPMLNSQESPVYKGGNMYDFHAWRRLLHGRKLPTALLLSLAVTPFAATTLHAESPESGVACCQALDLHARTTLDSLMPGLLDKQVIFVGETHDRYEHHL